VPIFASLGIVSVGMLAIEGRPLFDAALTAISGLNSSAFVAVLFFVIAAEFIRSGGIARVLIEAAEAWVGWLRGGIGLVAVLGTTLFAAVSGSSVVTATTMGTLLMPLMVARKYDRPFALGTLGAAGTLGILIPPSLSMILYGLVPNESVARLFLAGLVPGFVQALLFGAFVVLWSRRKNFSSGEPLPRYAVTPRAVAAAHSPPGRRTAHAPGRPRRRRYLPRLLVHPAHRDSGRLLSTAERECATHPHRGLRVQHGAATAR
jgi:C4-dicarboxylate transporter DctM subunit